MKNKVVDDNHCFACGKDNPSGLKLSFEYMPSTVTTHFTPQRIHQGFKNIVHGGIISTLLDEVMAHLCLAEGFYGVTAKLEVRFKKPAYINDELIITGELLEKKGRMLIAKAQAVNSKNEVVAFGNSTFVKVTEIL